MPFSSNQLMAPVFQSPVGDGRDHRPPVVSIKRAEDAVESGIRLHHNQRKEGYILQPEGEGLGVAPVELQTAPLASGGSVARHARLVEGDVFLPITLVSPVPSALPSMFDALVDIARPGQRDEDGLPYQFEVVVYDPYGQETRSRRLIFESGLGDPVRVNHHVWRTSITGRFVDPFWYGQVRELRRTLGSVDKKFITAKQGPPDPSQDTILHSWSGPPHKSRSLLTINGEVEATNYSLNPTFRDSVDGITTGSDDSTIEHWNSLWGRQGVADVNYVAGTTSWRSRVQLSDNILIPEDGVGKWAAFGVDLHRSTGGNWFGFRIQRSGSDWPEYEWHEAEPGWNRYVFSTQIIPGTNSIVPNVYVSETGDVNIPLERAGRFGMDNLVIAIADTEEEARAQVAEYFDGDTRDVTPQIGGYEFPFFPVRIGGSVVQGEYELTVEGDAPAYWSGVITPPGDDLLIQNAKGERIFVKGRVDEPILIQTRPQEQDITLADGTPIWDRIDPGDDDFFPLNPGRNTVHVSMVGATQQSEILIRYREAFFHSLGGGS